MHTCPAPNTPDRLPPQEDERITTDAARRSYDLLQVEQSALKDQAVTADIRAREAMEKLAALQVCVRALACARALVVPAWLPVRSQCRPPTRVLHLGAVSKTRQEGGAGCVLPMGAVSNTRQEGGAGGSCAILVQTLVAAPGLPALLLPAESHPPWVWRLMRCPRGGGDAGAQPVP